MTALKKILVSVLIWQARLILAKYKPFTIAVTGSVGKTSTKDAIYTVLKDHERYVRKSDKSFNSELGLPLTVIGVPNAWHSVSGWLRNIMAGFGLILRRQSYPDCIVLEVGADHPGDIRRIASWLRADIVLITKVSRTPVHVEFFKSPEEVFEEKASLVKALKPGGTLILYADDDKVAALAERVKGQDIRVLTFGVTKAATARAVDHKFLYDQGLPSGISFMLDLVGEQAPVSILGIAGESYIYPLLAAAAVGRARNISLANIAKSLSSFEPPRGRMRLISGKNGSVIIDDTYNSSPDAVVAALATLSHLETRGSKIAVLADMMELGKYSGEEHRNIGKVVATSATKLLTVGPRSKATADAARLSGMNVAAIHSCDTSNEAAAYLADKVKSHDVVLVKGSQSMRMERVVAAIMQDASQAGELLVRQEQEWLLKA